MLTDADIAKAKAVARSLPPPTPEQIQLYRALFPPVKSTVEASTQ